MSDLWDSNEDDSGSELDALDEYSPDDNEEHANHGLDVFGDYIQPSKYDEDSYLRHGEVDGHVVDGEINTALNEDAAGLMPDMKFAASNSAQTVTVTALLNGMIDSVELSPRAGLDTTEGELAAEIVSVAEVAATKAMSAQYELVYEVMQLQGQDRDSIRGLVEGIMRLPTPEQAIAAESDFLSRGTFGND